MRKLKLIAVFRCMVLPLLAIYLCSAVVNVFFIPRYPASIVKTTAVSGTKFKTATQQALYRLSNLLQIMDRAALHAKAVKVVRNFPIILFIALLALSLGNQSGKVRYYAHRFSPPYHYFITLRSIRI